ncbi:MAG: glycosyltransferase family 39 protein [Chloroflexota bacterium]
MSMAQPSTTTKLAHWELVCLAVILLLAVLARVVDLGRVPPGLSADELANSRMAERVLNGERPIWFEESFGHEPLYHYAQAVTMRLFGFNVWGIVLPSILAGVAAVWLIHALGRRAFGPAVGLIAAAALAVTWWPVFFSRVGLRIGGLVPLTVAAVYALWRGLEPADLAGAKPPSRRQRLNGLGWFLVAAIFLAAGLYTYSAARALPIALAIFIPYLSLFHRPGWRQHGAALLLAALLAMGLYWPLHRYLQTHQTADVRSAQISAPLNALKKGDVGPILQNTLTTLGAFGFSGDPKWRHNVAGRAMLTPAGAVFFYGGLLLALWRWRRPGYALVGLWWAAGLLPGISTIDAPSSNRLIVSLAPACLLLALGMVEAGRWLLARRRRALPLLIAAAVAIVLWEGVAALWPYFRTWPHHPQVREIYQATLTQVMHDLDSRVDGLPVCIGEPFVYDNYLWLPSRTLRRADPAAIRWFNPASALILPAGGAEARYVLPDHAPALELALDSGWFADATVEAVGAQQDESGQPVYIIYRLDARRPLAEKLAALAASGPVWTSDEVVFAIDAPPGARQPRALPVDFGHQLAFLGYELAAAEIAAGDTLTVLTYWRVLSPVDPPLAAIFVHLLDGQSQVRGQHDGLGARSPDWQPGDVIVQLHRFQVSPDAAPGHYWLELGAYTWVNWQRLPVYVDDAAVGDRLLLQGLILR